ncbi:NAD-dependent epimerase/dehydratase family protein [Cellulomonas marina]|uniref:Nucleoside-diphosphate-sugar epimerase n=1 Tax=Cellulomonas marina TaxID=988821 RepID=A0A1I0ZGI5_9CELL|nr:NAD(P)-dependent oxidoreductase [Cellulomonas marina]GIG28561.1 UDP-glucose 4-epimerase [Cellulomonas marina]SFB24765.1 Nucleoside-diphosphate-sugar epimerase [Cellulomonas marina]
MARVVVTGGSGKLGRAVVRDLAAHGWDVVNVDTAPPPADAPGSWTRVDLTDLGQVTEALTGIDDRYAGVDAVVHLAAIPAPGLRPSGATFANNVVATHHVFDAARRAGIRRVVWASSETLLGLPFDVPPPYVPVDEEYPVRPESTYSMGKAVEEEMARHFARWQPGATIVGLRFSNVMDVEDYARFPSFEDDPASRRWNLWGYIDARDGAQAVRRALTADVTGFEAFVIANADTVMTTPNERLLAEHFPDVLVRGDVTGTGTLLSIEKARRLLGYEPEHSWRDHVS